MKPQQIHGTNIPVYPDGGTVRSSEPVCVDIHAAYHMIDLIHSIQYDGRL